MKQFGDGQLEFGEQAFGEQLAPGQDAFQAEAVLGGVINLDVVVAWIDHPKPGQLQFFIDLFFDDGIGAMVIGADDFGCEPEFGRGRRYESEIGTDGGLEGEANLGTGCEQECAVKIGDTGMDAFVQAGADQFVARARGASHKGCAFEDFFVGLAHAGS